MLESPNGDQLVEHLLELIAERRQRLSPDELPAADMACKQAGTAVKAHFDQLGLFALHEALFTRVIGPSGTTASEAYIKLHWAIHQLTVEAARLRRENGTISKEDAHWLGLMEYEHELPEWLNDPAAWDDVAPPDWRDMEEREPDPYLASPDWRLFLHALDGLPLIPCGAGDKGKAPVNPETGNGLHNWQNAAFTVDQLAGMNGCVTAVGTRCGPDADGLLCLDLDGASAMALLQKHGIDPYNTWGVGRTTAWDRSKAFYRVPPELQSRLVKGKAKKITKTTQDGSASEQIEVIYSAGQALVLGHHRESDGWYDWHRSPAEIETLDEHHPVYRLVLELLGEPSCRPPAPLLAPLDHPGLARASHGPIPLEHLLSRELAGVWEQGGSEGSRNDDLFRLTVGLTTAADGGISEGLLTTGDPEQLAMQWAQRCSPPLPEHEARQTIRSALNQPRNPDPGLGERIALQLRRISQSREPGAVPPLPAAQKPPRDTRPDLEIIREAADRVVNEDVNLSRPQLIHRLRELVEDNLTRIPTTELYRREIGDAIQRRDGIDSKPYVGGEELPDDDDEWSVRDIIMCGALNIISADPKAGKTLLVLCLLAALMHGCDTFLDKPIDKRFNAVIIVGPDQSIRLWKKGLQRVGLVDGNRLDSRIVRIWDSKNPWVATYDGMVQLRQVCKDHPGSLVIFDSFSKVTEKLGIEENSREASEALSDIELACITYECTPLVIAHNAKAATRSGIVSGAAIRGHSSIRANASQIIILSLVNDKDPKNLQRRLVTEGRGDEPQDMLIRMEPTPLQWVREGEYSDYARQEQKDKQLANLIPAQQKALAALKLEGGALVPLRKIWQRIHPDSNWDPSDSSAKNLDRTLGQLLHKDLVGRSHSEDGRKAWSLTALSGRLPQSTWQSLQDD
jgi:hypothetical protein